MNKMASWCFYEVPVCAIAFQRNGNIDASKLQRSCSIPFLYISLITTGADPEGGDWGDRPP